MKSVYLGDFSSKSDVESQFAVGLTSEEILVACYSTGSYDGSAFVLFKQGNKLYEVNGSHCSCYGLEGQWEPEEVSVAELKHRVKEGNLGRYMYGSEDEILAAAAKVARMRSVI